MAKILKGKPVADKIIDEVKHTVEEWKRWALYPKLCVVRVGKNPSDDAYLRGIKRCAERCGIELDTATFRDGSPQVALEACLRDISLRQDISGVLLMRPLPKSMDEHAVSNSLTWLKDVDGMCDENIARTFLGLRGGFSPATARAVIELLDYYEYDLSGKNVCIIGRSPVIGKPFFAMLTNRDATVTLCHTKTKNIAEICRGADLVVSCAGKAGVVDKSMVNSSAWVVDVGINDDGNGGIVGDVDGDVLEVAAAITPVPGGVGTITSAILMKQVLEAAKVSYEVMQNTPTER